MAKNVVFLQIYCLWAPFNRFQVKFKRFYLKVKWRPFSIYFKQAQMHLHFMEFYQSETNQLFRVKTFNRASILRPISNNFPQNRSTLFYFCRFHSIWSKLWRKMFEFCIRSNSALLKLWYGINWSAHSIFTVNKAS